MGVEHATFPLLKPPTGSPGAARAEFILAGFPAKVLKDEEGNELPPDPDAPPPELVSRAACCPHHPQLVGTDRLCAAPLASGWRAASLTLFLPLAAGRAAAPVRHAWRRPEP